MLHTFTVLVCLALPVAADRAAREAEERRSPDESLARLKAMLAEIIEAQKQLRIERPDPVYPPDRPFPDPVIGEVPAVVLKRGGSATVRHTFEWRRYEYDELAISLRSSDDSLVVPESLTLDFEKHQFRFEYEIKAGDKAGEFTVTLQPAAGKAVTVQVIVK